MWYRLWYCIHKRSSFNYTPRHRYLHSPPTRTVSDKVHPLSVILRSVSDSMSWIIWLAASLSPRRSRSVPDYTVRHLLWTSWQWNRFSPCTSVSPCHFQSTNTPYSYVIDLRPMLYNFSNWLPHYIKYPLSLFLARLLHLHLSPRLLLLFQFFSQNSVHISCSPVSCYMPPSSHLLSVVFLNNVSHSIRILKLLVVFIMFFIAVCILLIMPTLFSNDLSLCSSLTVPGNIYVTKRGVCLSKLR